MKGAFRKQYPQIENLLVLAGAEMDFATAPVIRRALAEFAERGIYGFTLADAPYRAAVCRWMERVRDFAVDPQEIVVTLGTVKGIATAVRAFTDPGDGVIIQHPSYYRFDDAVRRNGRVVVPNPLRERNGVYELDFADLERKMAVPRNRMMILCNPHNPTGRVFGAQELEQIARLARRYQVLVLSDEIFAETVAPGFRAPVYAQADPYSIVSTSLGKCFNFTGVNHANLIIRDAKLREAYVRRRDIDHFGSVDPFFYAAVLAAYSEEGYAWVKEMNAHTEENYQTLTAGLADGMPEIRVSPHEGSFVAWLDLRGLGMDDEEMNRWLLEDCGVLADAGREYGVGGEGHIRINLATPRAQIEAFVRRLRLRNGG